MRCWRVDPRLPVLSFALVLVPLVPSLLTSVNTWLGFLAELLLIPLALFNIGFYGTQRIWYARLSMGQTLERSEISAMSWGFLGRFAALGVLTGWPVLLASIAYFTSLVVDAAHRGGHVQIPPLFSSPLLLLVVLLSLVWDFALTFATPALAFTTPRARDAFWIGLRMIRDTWPAAALYVMFPPLALQVISQLPNAFGTRSLPLVYAITFAVSVANLAAKGAVTFFYMRHKDVGDGNRVLPAASVSRPAVQPS